MGVGCDQSWRKRGAQLAVGPPLRSPGAIPREPRGLSGVSPVPVCPEASVLPGRPGAAASGLSLNEALNPLPPRSGIACAFTVAWGTVSLRGLTPVYLNSQP